MTSSAKQTIQVHYFAWVREKIGHASEACTPPDTVITIADFVAWLKTKGPQYDAAFANASIVRAAIDQTHASPDAKISGAKEIAFFPPVTGG